ncbi:esterase [Rhodococcus rhodochrous]|uniref:alpha/beta hydrolase n=1 Tax=Rhodococcus rhodochrous TaxID=1829 RepID=UPI0007509563|nr:alpha/beta hydrolase [Rhodococcus rhodochrous]MDO1483278.1 alpha/beta hydrolase [Rhodococcus rhodochrous]SNV14920.1 esterase [Rhodococcus rhodochrous]
MSEGSTDRAPRRRVGRWILIVFVVVLVVVAAAFVLTPVPGSLVVRKVFERDAREQTAKLAVGAPETDFVADLHYREDDPDAYLDVYTPPGTTEALPTIVWTHGGAWLSGNRTNYAGYYRRLAGAGFTVVSVGYSLAPGHRYPTPVRQLVDAQSYLLEHADELHIDTDRIVLAGDSAGAQLSAQIAAAVTDPDYAATLGVDPAFTPENVRGVVLNCGIYDVSAIGGSGGLIGWGVEQAMWAYTGAREFATSDAAGQMSVLNSVTENFPATYISGGNADPLTATQSERLAQRLTGLGVQVDALFYPDDHTPELAHEYQFDLSTPDARAALERTIDFVRKVTT